MATQITYADLAINESDHVLLYGLHGFKLKRQFVINWVSNVNPASTLYNAYLSGSMSPSAIPTDGSDPDDTQLPLRGSPHPTIVITNNWSDYLASVEEGDSNAFRADTFTLHAISSTQVRVDVEYSVMDGSTQEASGTNDSAPGALSIASSVQTTQTANDINGNPIAYPYESNNPEASGYPTPLFTISQNGTNIPFVRSTYPSGSPGDPFVPGTPSNKSVATVQRPTATIRFSRRETVSRNLGVIGLVNSMPWEVAGFNYPAQTVVGTRCENKSYDNQVSFMVDYEFQYAPLQPIPKVGGEDVAVFIPPATTTTDPELPDSPLYSSPWQVGGYYVIQAGIGTNSTATPAQVLPAGQTPPDCAPFIFQVYGLVDFNALNLYFNPTE